MYAYIKFHQHLTRGIVYNRIMAGFLTCSPMIGRLPKNPKILSGNKICRGCRTYSYGYSSGFTPDSLLLTAGGSQTVTP